MKRNGWVWLLAAATVLACGTEEVGSGSLGGMPPTAGSQRCQERNGQSVPLTAGDTRMRFCRIDDALIEEFTLEKAVGDREDTRATEALFPPFDQVVAAIDDLRRRWPEGAVRSG